MAITDDAATHARVATSNTLAALARRLVRCCLAVGLLATGPAAALAQVDVLSNRYDDARTGANLSETTLTTANVNVDTFGKLYSYRVDGAVYAQPLYVAGVTVKGAVRNVLFIATMNDKVYAFDADNQSASPLWTTDFSSPPSVTPVPVRDIVGGNLDIVGNVGIESTPVIDRTAGTIYLVARTKDNGSFVQRLHALDITTGLPRSGSPTTITATVPGSAPDSTVDPGGQVITFNPKMEQQRAALAITHNVVLVSWAGHHDLSPYHGWVMGFDTTTLRLVGAFAVTPDVDGGGIWQGGRAPTIDAAGNAYFATGNGKWDSVRNFGDSLLKFSVSRTGISLLSYFTPMNENILNVNDDDLSGSGFTLLPDTSLLLGGGKEGVLYLLDINNLGGKTATDSQVVQKIVVNGGHVMGGPVYWNAPGVGPLVYNWSEDDVLTAYRLLNGKLSTPPYATGVARSPGHPGGSLIVSANGSVSHSGIVWASMPRSEDAISGLHAGILRAYNAETLTEIWTSEQNAARDKTGTLIKFVPPVVADGKVYMASHDNAVAVYGLFRPDFGVDVTPLRATVVSGGNATFSVSVGARGGFAGRVDLSASGAPAGATVTFTPQFLSGGGIASLTLAVPANAPAGDFTMTVNGTSGTTVRTAPPLVVSVTPPEGGLSEIVRYASRATLGAGTWHVVDEATAAGGRALEHPDAGVAKPATPLAAPNHYAEVTFDAEAGRAYRLWLRGRAKSDLFSNDSVWVQFDNAVTASGAPAYRIGTTQASSVIIEECAGCGLSGWGWADNGYGGLGPLIYFAATGRQTMRLQGREDGISIDQIVLSAAKYLNTAPGAAKNDARILAETGAPPPPPPPSGDVILYAADAITSGAWRVASDVSAAGGARIEHPDAGAAKLGAALANPTNFFELTFTAEAGRPYHLWLRGRAAGNSWTNDSVFVQFDRSTNASGASVQRIGTTDAGIVTLEDCLNCGVAGWGWQDNGFGAGVLGDPIYFAATGTQTIRIQTREDGFSIDQIVLSPSTYLTVAPGPLKNDTTILPR